MTLKRSSRVNSLQGSISKNRTWLTALLSLCTFLWFGVIELVSLNFVHGTYDSDMLTKELNNTAAQFLCQGSVSYGLVMVMALFLGMQGFVFLFDGKKVDFYFSQPVKKMTLFTALYINGILQYVCIFGGGMVLGLIIAVSRGAYFTALIPSMLCEFVVLFVQFIAFYTIAILATILCGNLFAAFCSVGFFMLAEIFIRLLIMGLESTYFKSYYDDYSVFSFGLTTPILNYVNGVTALSEESFRMRGVSEAFVQSLPGLFANLLMTAVYFAVAYFVFKNRKNESAGKSVAIASMENVYKIVIAVVGGVGMELMVNGIMEETSPFSVSAMFAMFMGIFAVCVVAEGVFALNVKSIFKRAWHMPLIFVGCLVIILGFKFDILGYDSFVPKEQDVKSVVVMPTGYTDFKENYDVYGMYGEDVKMNEGYTVSDTGAALELARAGMEFTRNNDDDAPFVPSTDVMFAYNMKNGKTIKRSVKIPATVDADLMNRILSDDHYAEGFVGLPYSKETAKEFVKDHTFTAEGGISGLSGTTDTGYFDLLRDGGESISDPQKLFDEFMENYLADVDEHFDYDTIRNSHVIMRIQFSGEKADGTYRSLYYPVFENYDRTLAFLEKYGDPVSDEEYEKYINSILPDISQMEVDRSYYSEYSDEDYTLEDLESTGESATQGITYKTQDEIRKILLLAGRGSVYTDGSEMPFADYTGYYRVQLYSRNYGYISSFAVLKERMPQFVIDDLK